MRKTIWAPLWKLQNPAQDGNGLRRLPGVELRFWLRRGGPCCTGASGWCAGGAGAVDFGLDDLGDLSGRSLHGRDRGWAKVWGLEVDFCVDLLYEEPIYIYIISIKPT